MSSIVFTVLTAGAALLTGAQPPEDRAPAGEPPAGMTPPASFISAAQGLGQCIQTAVGAVPVSATPEVAAAQAVAGCASQKAALETQFETWVASPAFPVEGRAIAREQFRTEMGKMNAEIAEGIRQGRAAAAAAPKN